jgi:hypothetical protein
MAWVERLGFDSQQEKKFYILDFVQTASGAHPVSYPMGIRGSSRY